MNDFEEVINDLKMLKDKAHWVHCYSTEGTNILISYNDFTKIVQNAIDLLEEYNNDRG